MGVHATDRQAQSNYIQMSVQMVTSASCIMRWRSIILKPIPDQTYERTSLSISGSTSWKKLDTYKRPVEVVRRIVPPNCSPERCCAACGWIPCRFLFVWFIMIAYSRHLQRSNHTCRLWKLVYSATYRFPPMLPYTIMVPKYFLYLPSKYVYEILGHPVSHIIKRIL